MVKSRDGSTQFCRTQGQLSVGPHLKRPSVRDLHGSSCCATSRSGLAEVAPTYLFLGGGTRRLRSGTAGRKKFHEVSLAIRRKRAAATRPPPEQVRTLPPPFRADNLAQPYPEFLLRHPGSGGSSRIRSDRYDGHLRPHRAHSVRISAGGAWHSRRSQRSLADLRGGLSERASDRSDQNRRLRKHYRRHVHGGPGLPGHIAVQRSDFRLSGYRCCSRRRTLLFAFLEACCQNVPGRNGEVHRHG